MSSQKSLPSQRKKVEKNVKKLSFSTRHVFLNFSHKIRTLWSRRGKTKFLYKFVLSSLQIAWNLCEVIWKQLNTDKEFHLLSCSWKRDFDFLEKSWKSITTFLKVLIFKISFDTYLTYWLTCARVRHTFELIRNLFA